LEDAFVDGIDDEIAETPGSPDALSLLPANAATIFDIGRGNAQRIEFIRDAAATPAVNGKTVVDPLDQRGLGPIGPDDDGAGDETGVRLLALDGEAEGDNAAAVAALAGGTVHASGREGEELAAVGVGHDGLEAEHGLIADGLGDADEGDAEGLEEGADLEEVDDIPAQAVRSGDPDFRALLGGSGFEKAAAIGTEVHGDSAGDAVIAEAGDNLDIGLGGSKAVEDFALGADGFSFALVIGTDAFIEGDLPKGWCNGHTPASAGSVAAGG
jgi:hypothetical protein